MEYNYILIYALLTLMLMFRELKDPRDPIDIWASFVVGLLWPLFIVVKSYSLWANRERK